MTLTGQTLIAGVIGSPVKHSLSPLIMSNWIKAAAIDGAYIPLAAHPDLTVDDLRALSRVGLRGLNVTLPFKSLALKVADKVDYAARQAGAANLLVFEGDEIKARNTDIEGIHYALNEAGASFSGRRVLVLGAGGVARAIIVAARQAGATSIAVSNRTIEKARGLARDFPIEVLPWQDRQIAAQRADMVFNATSLGMDGQSDPELNWTDCPSNMLVFDTVYTPRLRPFTERARSAGLMVIDGLSMLIGQARPSFEALYGKSVPDSVDIRSLLERALS